MSQRQPLAIVTLLALLPACGLFSQYTAKILKTIKVPHVAGFAIDVQSRNGSIQVLGGSAGEEVEVLATIVAGGQTQAEAEDRLQQIVVRCTRDAENRLVIRAEYPDQPRSRDGVSYVVRIPTVDGARLHTSNGSVTAKSLAGALRVNTSNGLIVVHDHQGAATLETSNGSVRVQRHAGTVTVRTSNGGVAVELTDDQTGPVSIDTSNGGVELTVGPGFQGSLRMDTSNGRVRVDNSGGTSLRQRIRRRSGTVTFGEDGEASRVHSSNGSITLNVK